MALRYSTLNDMLYIVVRRGNSSTNINVCLSNTMKDEFSLIFLFFFFLPPQVHRRRSHMFHGHNIIIIHALPFYARPLHNIITLYYIIIRYKCTSLAYAFRRCEHDITLHYTHVHRASFVLRAFCILSVFKIPNKIPMVYRKPTKHTLTSAIIRTWKVGKFIIFQWDTVDIARNIVKRNGYNNNL